MQGVAPLPESYPIADATWDEKQAWLDAPIPPYRRIREAAPWLAGNAQVDWYLDGLRAAASDPDGFARINRLFGFGQDVISK